MAAPPVPTFLGAHAVKLVVEAFLLNVGLPALVSAVVLAVALAITRRGGPSRDVGWGVALAVGAGYLAGHFAVAWPMSDVTDRIPWLAVVATALGTLEAAWPTPAWARWENRVLFSALVLAVMLSAAPAIVEALGTRASILWVAAVGAGIVVSWANLEGLAARSTGVALVLPLLAVTGGASIVLAIWSLVPGQLGGALTAALGGAWVASWWRGPLSLARGGVTILIMVLAALILYAHVFAEMAVSCVALLAVAPLMIWVTRIGPIRRLASWQAGLIGVAVVLVPIGIAAWLAHKATSSASAYGY
jgi:hypothetical protein